jgi:light-independent protochlorophyllide reductase subunit B
LAHRSAPARGASFPALRHDDLQAQLKASTSSEKRPCRAIPAAAAANRNRSSTPVRASWTATTAANPLQAVGTAVAGAPTWTPEGEAELHKIPFFVRGKVRRNTEAFASERGLARIDAETLYDAKAHLSR